MTPVCERCQLPVFDHASAWMREQQAVCSCNAPQRPLPAPETRAAAVPGVSGRRSLGQRMIDLAESDVVDAIQGEFEARGWRVLRVGQRRAKGSGTTVGCPDLFLRDPGWPRAMWFGCEVKGPGTHVRREQQALADADAIVVVRSLAEMMEAVS